MDFIDKLERLSSERVALGLCASAADPNNPGGRAYLRDILIGELVRRQCKFRNPPPKRTQCKNMVFDNRAMAENEQDVVDRHDSSKKQRLGAQNCNERILRHMPTRGHRGRHKQEGETITKFYQVHILLQFGNGKRHI
jgi:hypothetical protein